MDPTSESLATDSYGNFKIAVVGGTESRQVITPHDGVIKERAITEVRQSANLTELPTETRTERKHQEPMTWAVRQRKS